MAKDPLWPLKYAMGAKKLADTLLTEDNVEELKARWKAAQPHLKELHKIATTSLDFKLRDKK